MCGLEISVGIKLVQNGFIFYLKILYSTLMTYIFYKMEGLVIKLGGGRGGGGGVIEYHKLGDKRVENFLSKLE